MTSERRKNIIHTLTKACRVPPTKHAVLIGYTYIYNNITLNSWQHKLVRQQIHTRQRRNEIKRRPHRNKKASETRNITIRFKSKQAREQESKTALKGHTKFRRLVSSAEGYCTETNE